jgi:hypothetical protein
VQNWKNCFWSDSVRGKVAQNVAQSISCEKEYTNCTVEKIAKLFVLLLYFSQKLPKVNSHPTGKNSPNPGLIFCTFFPGKIPRKIFPQKCWEKLQFSAEKVLKNHFFSTNSTEFSAENHFPREKMYEKSAPGHTVR